jgi:hypothetical protein
MGFLLFYMALAPMGISGTHSYQFNSMEPIHTPSPTMAHPFILGFTKLRSFLTGIPTIFFMGIIAFQKIF